MSAELDALDAVREQKERRERIATAFAARLIDPDLLRAWRTSGRNGDIAAALGGIPVLARMLADALIEELDR